MAMGGETGLMRRSFRETSRRIRRLFPRRGDPSPDGVASDSTVDGSPPTAFGGLGDGPDTRSTETSEPLRRPQAGSEPDAATDEADRPRPRRDAPPGPVRLVIADVDGTLVDGRGELSRTVQTACRRLLDHGIALILATARSPRGVYRTQRELTGVPLSIACNGAIIWNRLAKRPLHHRPLEPELVREIVNVAREVEPEVMIGLEQLDGWHTDRWPRRIISVLPDLTPPDSVRPLEALLGEPVTRLNLIALPERMTAIRYAVSAAFWRTRRVSVFPGDRHLMQLTHPYADKAIAAQRIARRLQISGDEVMVIGDGPNDLGLFSWAGFSVAVANACRPIRQAADVIVASNDDHGAAEAIEKYALAPAPGHSAGEPAEPAG